MATPTYSEVISQINTFIVTNHNNEITANVLNPILVLLTDFTNNTIGDLETLTTDEKDTIVDAINSLKNNLNNITNNGVQLYSGMGDPNVTPPPTYKPADFYLQVDSDSLPVQLWQFNAFSWISSVNGITALWGEITGDVEDQTDLITLIDTKDTETLNSSKTYTDSLVVGLLDDRGNYDASTNVFPSTGGSGTSGAILKGDLWYVSVAGTLGGTPVQIGDSFRALIDNPAQIASNWSILSSNLGYVPANDTNVIHKTLNETKTGQLIVTPVDTSINSIVGNTIDGAGVFGNSTNGFGVFGIASNNIGVAGQGQTGVQGSSIAGTGVQGVSSDGTGVEGLSSTAIAVRASSTEGLALLANSVLGAQIASFQANNVEVASINSLGNFIGNKFIKVGGTNLQYLMADGSVSAGNTNVGTVTAVSALVLGTSGLNPSSTVVNPTTVPTISLNIPMASTASVTAGLISNADWVTFNNKQSTITNPVTGTGVNGQISFWSGANAQSGDSAFIWDNTNKRLGIGTTAPNANLQVLTNNFANSLTFNSVSSIIIGSAIRQLAINAADNSGTFNISMQARTNASASTDLILQPLGGNVGLGTTNPLSRLHVFGNIQSDTITVANSGGYFTGGDVGVSFGQYATAPNGAWMQSTRFNDVAFPLTINPNGGAVGIGTKTPVTTSILTLRTSTAVSGNLSLINRNATRRWDVGIDQLSIDDGTFLIQDNTAGLARLIIDTAGNIGIGTTVATQKLHVIGNILASGTITPSDIRLKSNIKPIANALDYILKMNPVKFDKKWQIDGKIMDTDFGFVAQELKEIFPFEEIVKTPKKEGDLLSVKYNSIIAILTKGMQELKAEVDFLKQKINLL